MPCLSSPPPVAPGLLAQVWRVGDLAAEEAVVSSGHAGLDSHLPGGGWPLGSLIEVLQQRPGQHVWQLLLPGLVQASASRAGPIVLVGSPHEPFGPCLNSLGLPCERLLCVQAQDAPARLWATEQALRCAEVAAVLAWLPQARSAQLRRLHLAARQQGSLLFVFRGWNARHEASPARLRLSVAGVDAMELHILKRRGPTVALPLRLPAFSARVSALLHARKGLTGADALAVPGASHGRSRVLDRSAAIA